MTFITFAVCFIVGELIKLLFKSLDKKWLPFIVGAFGMVFCPFFCWDFTLVTISEGLVAGFASSGGYDALKTINKQFKSL